MLFNSFDFALFLPIFFVLYWFVTKKKIKAQNLLICIASYIFYGWWNWRFLSLIIFSSSVDYIVGIYLAKTNNQKRRKLLLLTSILVNIGLLGFFKYFNFFTQSFADSFTLLGKEIDPFRLNIILPVGISFYTFQTLSYSIDVYKRKLEPTKDIIAFFAFVSFFPQLVAGPIERATNLLPQFYNRRNFDYNKAIDGLGQILWGLLKKMVIADNCALYANTIFNNFPSYSSSTLLLGAFFFAFQIYGDFSGYSDISIGTAKLFGFKLMRNFAFPYFSRDIAEFWRRWHISLSTWFRDYVYIPLGGSQVNKWMKIRNTMIIFIVSGFWHGANWTFIIWGFLNALFFLPLLLYNRNRKHIDIVAKDKYLPSIREFFSILLTFSLTTFSWIFFRATSIKHAMDYIAGIIDISLFSFPEMMEIRLMIITALFILVEWQGRENKYAIEGIFKNNVPEPLKWSCLYLIALIIFLFAGQQQEFIYFQF
ncbi:MAG: MBOAT family O-acyltransferase [bacterium]